MNVELCVPCRVALDHETVATVVRHNRLVRYGCEQRLAVGGTRWDAAFDGLASGDLT